MHQSPRTIILTTGGTGGHIFPAEALAEILVTQGHHVSVITDARFAQYHTTTESVFHRIPIHVTRAVSLQGNAIKKIVAITKTCFSIAQAWRIIRRTRPDIVVGFGGYPSFPAMIAASWCGVPTILHEQNAILGKTNRTMAARVRWLATSFRHTQRIDASFASKTTYVGNPVRASVQSIRQLPYPSPNQDGNLHLLITGGSQGASIFADIIPAAITLLPPEQQQRLHITQQARPEQIDRLTQAYHALGIRHELAPFFTNMPTRLAAAQVVIARSGASTIAELTCAGRPALFVPLPTSADGHQLENARAMTEAGGGWLCTQADFTPQALATQLQQWLTYPEQLTEAARHAHHLGTPESAALLATLVIESL
jgi:UDP-N-acetylglucosamine--N-acetylmuramyl-(pentapeptide) pyrophosphoryl-undecaprenol N-acetylglucosamine transferase